MQNYTQGWSLFVEVTGRHVFFTSASVYRQVKDECFEEYGRRKGEVKSFSPVTNET